MSGRRLALWLLVAAANASSAAAQTPSISGYFTGGTVSLAASESFDAVAGSSRALSLGGGATVAGLWGGLFVDLAVTRQKMDGERVFVSNGAVFPLGIPWQATFVPIDLTAGWRWSGGHVISFVGAGATFVKYSERSDFAQDGDDVNQRKVGAVLLGGVEVPLASWIRVGGDVRYRLVKGVLGAGGVSELFGEDQLGGVSTAVRVTVGRR